MHKAVDFDAVSGRIEEGDWAMVAVVAILRDEAGIVRCVELVRDQAEAS
jgi:hypothetical protein